MKKFIFAVAALLICVAANADLTSTERVFLNSVKNYLTEEGYKPSIDEDDDLVFKVEGTTYWVTVSDEPMGDENYFYVQVCTDMGAHDVNLDAVRKAINQVNREYKVGKCYLTPSQESIMIKITEFCYSSHDLIKFLSRYVKILDQMNSDLSEYYDQYK